MCSTILHAAKDFREVVRKDLCVPLARAKAVVVASEKRLAERIRRALGEDGGEPSDTAVALGVEYAAGKAQRMHSKRLKKSARQKKY